MLLQGLNSPHFHATLVSLSSELIPATNGRDILTIKSTLTPARQLRVRVLATKPDDLNSVPRPTLEEREKPTPVSCPLTTQALCSQ